MLFEDALGIRKVAVSRDRVELEMDIVPTLFQPHGFLHGGATLSLLETAASIGADERADFTREMSFGTRADIRHRKPGKHGVLHGVAEFLDEEEYAPGARRQTWRVTARDDAGDVVSEGTFQTKIVTIEYFERKNHSGRDGR